MIWLFAEKARLGRELSLCEDVRLSVGSDGRIAAIERGVRPQPGDRVLPGTVVPGLIDLHVHLALDGGADVVASLQGRSSHDRIRQITDAATAHVKDGVTSVRDLGSPDSLVGTTVRRLPLRVAWAGAITPPGGHGHFIAREARGAAATRDAVRLASEAGARWIKVFATGGVITAGSRPSDLLATPEELQVAVDAAHAVGCRVAAHAHGSAGILAAIDAGCDTVEHVSHVDERVLQELRASSTVPVSTLVATERFVHSPAVETSDPETVGKIREHAPFERASLHRLLEAGLRLCAGTDAGTTHNPHGGGIAWEGRLLREAGASARGVLKILTVENASFVDGPVGYLEEGRLADLAAFGGDPAVDVFALARPLVTIIGGEVVSEVPPPVER